MRFGRGSNIWCAPSYGIEYESDVDQMNDALWRDMGNLYENESIPSRTSTSNSSTTIEQVLPRFEELHIDKKRSSVHLGDGCTCVRHGMDNDDGNHPKVPRLSWTSTILYGKYLQVLQDLMTSWNTILESLLVASVDRRYRRRVESVVRFEYAIGCKFVWEDVLQQKK